MQTQTEAHTVQRMLDWLEEHLAEPSVLLALSAQIGYSPCYCSQLFHKGTGETLRRYVASRRLAVATLALRDTDRRILDVALDVGFGSQEALTRAFVAAYGLTPFAYRRQPSAMRIRPRRHVLFPEHREGGIPMEKTGLMPAGVRIAYVPAHRYIGIRDDRVQDYMSFWDHHDCDAVCGVVESMAHVADPIIGPHTAGWYDNGKGGTGYQYGFGVDAAYDAEIPEGFSVWDVPGAYYLVFYHPPFDFMQDNCPVMEAVEALARDYDAKASGFAYETPGWAYQRHMPETVGYEIMRPVKRL